MIATSLALLLISSIPISGCSILVAANANHNSRGTYCVETPVYSLIDFGVTAALGVGLGATHQDGDSLSKFIVPAVFLASGVVGSIATYRCRVKARERAGQGTPVGTERTPSIHSSGPGEAEAPTAPNARAQEETKPGAPKPKTSDPLRLREDYELPEPVGPKDVPVPVSCTIGSIHGCPTGQFCIDDDDGNGTCSGPKPRDQVRN